MILELRMSVDILSCCVVSVIVVQNSPPASSYLAFFDLLLLDNADDIAFEVEWS